jgi:hypothetical protein
MKQHVALSFLLCIIGARVVVNGFCFHHGLLSLLGTFITSKSIAAAALVMLTTPGDSGSAVRRLLLLLMMAPSSSSSC